MRISRFTLGVATFVFGMFLFGLSQKTYAQTTNNNAQSNTVGVNAGANKDIRNDTKDIQGDLTEMKDDTAEIKTDRQALRDALKSGDAAKIQAARETLHKAIGQRHADRKDLSSDRQERRSDIKSRRASRGK